MSARSVQERGEGWGGGRREWEKKRGREELTAGVRALACVQDPGMYIYIDGGNKAKGTQARALTACVEVRALACVEDPKSVLRTTSAKAARPHNNIHVCVCACACGEV